MPGRLTDKKSSVFFISYFSRTNKIHAGKSGKNCYHIQDSEDIRRYPGGVEVIKECKQEERHCEEVSVGLFLRVPCIQS